MDPNPTYEELKARVKELEQEVRSLKASILQTGIGGSLFQTAIDALPCPVFYKDSKGCYQAGNRAWCEEVIGLPMESILGKTVLDFDLRMPRELAEKYHEIDLEILASGSPKIYEAKVRCSNGEQLDFMFHKKVHFDSRGQKVGIIGIMLNVSDLTILKEQLQRKEQDLINANERLEDILFALPNGVFIIDAKTHKIIDVNPQASLLVGLPSDKIIGNLCHEFICPNKINNCPITDLKKSIERTETSLLTHAGVEVPILKTALRLELDGRDCLLESFVDISDQKQAEELKMEQSKIEAVLETIGAVCHELNQPLMIVSGFAELMLKQLHDPDKVAEYANTIIDQVDRIGSITRRMMKIDKYTTQRYLNSKILDLDS